MKVPDLIPNLKSFVLMTMINTVFIYQEIVIAVNSVFLVIFRDVGKHIFEF